LDSLEGRQPLCTKSGWLLLLFHLGRSSSHVADSVASYDKCGSGVVLWSLSRKDHT
jgi:hypothetical protein